VVAAPASLKGALSAVEAAAALVTGFRGAGIEATALPVADGGDGTAAVLEAALGGEWRDACVSDAFGRPIDARWLLLPDGTAVVESAEAIGLRRLAPEELDPIRASSRGLGELILAAARAEPRSLLVGLGGSASVDGGAGMREVLDELPYLTTVLHDVRTMLAGAARTFGPQKGATPAQVTELEERLAAISELVPFAGLPGAGAAGGLGAAFAALGAELVPGASYVLERIGLRARVHTVDLVVTGEGRVDRTTLDGKAPGEVANVCRNEGVRCVLFGGTGSESIPGAELHVLTGGPMRSAEDLRALGERLGRALR
jgi:glycerate kinase